MKACALGLLLASISSGCSIVGKTDGAVKTGLDVLNTAQTGRDAYNEMFPNRPPKDYVVPALPVVLSDQSVHTDVDPQIADEYHGLLRATYSSIRSVLQDSGWANYSTPRNGDIAKRGYAVLDDFGAAYDGFVITVELDYFKLSNAGSTGLEIQSGKHGKATASSAQSHLDCKATVRVEKASPNSIDGVVSGTGTFGERESKRAIEASAVFKDLNVKAADQSTSELAQTPALDGVLKETLAAACRDLFNKPATTELFTKRIPRQ